MSSNPERVAGQPDRGEVTVDEKNSGVLFIVSAPSGSGKSTLVRRVLKDVGHLRFSISHTTRPSRPDEQQGVDYFFVTRDEFEGMIREGKFVEHAVVYGNYYGTSWEAIEAVRSSGDDVILDIDVQGAAQVKQRFGREAPSIFVLPPSFQSLEQRLRGRSSDGDEVIRERLSRARQEIQEYKKYDYVIINDEINRATDALRSIIVAYRACQSRLEKQIENILHTFGGNPE
ncbi:MAG: guanylate kinase [Acidobacteriia bacterium]|nr:guanylate kinase [Terriglobia bacterium]